MPDLGNAVLRLIVNGKGFKQGLATAEQQTTKFAAKGEKQVGRVRGAFGKLGMGIKGAAGQVPLLGGAMTALANPITAIAVGVGAVAVALGKMVGRIVDAEQALRPMVERSGLASDSLQLLAAAAERAGSEDGLEGVTDSAQELQLRLAEVVQDGTGPAAEAFRKLGISAQDLIDKSPEDMLLTVVAALQNVTNEADRKFLADELLGGSSEKLAGLLNLTNEELGNQLQHLADTGDFMSGEALADAKAYSEGMDELKSSFGRIATEIGSVLIPILTGLIEALDFMGKGLDSVANVLGWAKPEVNEFTEAADEMAEVLGDGTAPAIEVTREAAEEAAPAIAEVGKAAEGAEPKVRLLTEASDDAAESVKLWAAANRASSQQMIEDSALRLKNLLADYADELATEGKLIGSQKLLGRAFSNTGEAADALAYDIDLLDGDTSDLFRNIDHYVEPEINELAEALREAGRDTNALSRLFLDGKITAGEFATAVADARIANEEASVAIEEAAGDVDVLKRLLAAGAITAREFAAALLSIPNEVNTRVNVTGMGRPGGSASSGAAVATSALDAFSGRLMDADATFIPDNFREQIRDAQVQVDAGTASSITEVLSAPGAQHGAAVRGSRYGSLVRVGENFTNENITPVGRNGAGSGGGSGQMVIPVNLGGETLATIYVEGKRVAVREGRD